MAPEMDFENFSTYADVDKEYDFEAEIENAKEHLLQKERLEAECKRLELELRMKEIERERNIYSDEDRLIERVIHLFRGRRISQRTFDIICREIQYCVEPVLDEHIMWQEYKMMEMRKMMIPERTYKFRWSSDIIQEEEPKKDFIEEDDMKL